MRHWWIDGSAVAGMALLPETRSVTSLLVADAMGLVAASAFQHQTHLETDKSRHEHTLDNTTKTESMIVTSQSAEDQTETLDQSICTKTNFFFLFHFSGKLNKASLALITISLEMSTIMPREPPSNMPLQYTSIGWLDAVSHAACGKQICNFNWAPGPAAHRAMCALRAATKQHNQFDNQISNGNYLSIECFSCIVFRLRCARVWAYNSDRSH